MTLGHDDGLRVKRPSGISPPSIVRGGTVPNSSSSEARCLQRKVWSPWQAWTPVLGVRADWLAPEPPMSPGGVCLDPHGQAQNSHPTVSGRHWVAPGAAGRRVATSPLGTRLHGKASVSALGLEEGVGFNPRVDFDGDGASESGKSRLVRDLPLPEDHCATATTPASVSTTTLRRRRPLRPSATVSTDDRSG